MNPVAHASSALTANAAQRMEQRGLVSRSPEVMHGALVFAGTRVLVDSLFDYLLEGRSVDAFLEDFPSVSRAAALGVLEQVRANLAA